MSPRGAVGPVLLATSREFADGEPGHEHLDAAFAAAGIEASWRLWDDPSVDWTGAPLVCVRSTWDYDGRLPEFLAWADAVGPALLHGADAFRWNTDKIYLADLARTAGLPVVPTSPVAVADDVAEAVARFGTTVIKPRVGAGGRGVVIVADAADWVPGVDGPWIAQPLVESVRTEGETSVFVLGGRAVSQVSKVVSGGEIRVHEHFGGRVSATPLTDQAADLAVRAVAASSSALGQELTYARIDLLRHEGRLVVSEIEVTEPGLYLDVLPGNGAAFVEAVLAAGRPSPASQSFASLLSRSLGREAT